MKFEIGHHEIDHHHEELFDLDTRLDSAISGNRRADLEPIIDFLEHYSQDHFAEEEALMKAHDYKGYNLHKSEHEFFVKFVNEIRSMYTDNKPAAHIIFKLRRLIDQLIHHIITIDKGIAPLVREH